MNWPENYFSKLIYPVNPAMYDYLLQLIEPKYQETILLRFRDGLTWKEVTQITGRKSPHQLVNLSIRHLYGAVAKEIHASLPYSTGSEGFYLTQDERDKFYLDSMTRAFAGTVEDYRKLSEVNFAECNRVLKEIERINPVPEHILKRNERNKCKRENGN